MSGLPEFNAPAFREAADHLRQMGHDVISPVELDEESGFDHSSETINDTEYESFLARDIERISRGIALGELDGGVALTGYDGSRGAALEAHTIRTLGRPVYRIVQSGTEYAFELEQIHAPDVQRHPSSARFHAILRDLASLHDRKQQDYGSESDPFANVRAAGSWGVDEWVGAMIRATDKVRRLEAFARKGSLANESAEDAFQDLAVYAVIALVLYEEASAQN